MQTYFKFLLLIGKKICLAFRVFNNVSFPQQLPKFVFWYFTLYFGCFSLSEFFMVPCTCHAAAAKSLQSCLTLCDPIDGSPPGSPVPEILQARTLEWVAISFSNAWKWKVKSESEVAQSCPTLSDPMDCSLPGSSVHGIF